MDLAAEALIKALPLFVETIGAGSGRILADPEALAAHGRAFHPDLSAPEAPAQLDVILFDALDAPEGLLPALRRARLRAQRQGAVLLRLDAAAWPVENCVDALRGMGLAFYRGWRCDGGALTPWAEKEIPTEGVHLLRFQRAGYSPMLHAREYLKKGEFGTALSILHETPDAWYATEEERGLHGAELLMAYLAQDRFIGPRLRLQHLVSAMRAYTKACTLAPMHVPAYQCMAAFWKGVGRPDLARRLLTTVTTILDAPEAEKDLTQLPPDPAPTPPVTCPAWDPAWRPRILYLCHVESDYGADLLYDGLRRLLGAENVLEYPWKPTVHGQKLDQAFGYPCTFHWPDGPTPLAEVVRRAAAGAFDVILFSDTTGTLPKDEIHPILAAAGDVPLFVVDTWDECGAFLEDIRRDAGLGPVAGYFKREMIAGIDYGPDAWPLPFAYADDRIPDLPEGDQRDGVFFAGKLIGGTRRLMLSWLHTFVEVKGGWGTPFTQEEYAALLREQAIGLCLFGNGFDTVRYWELPAHGVLLLAERSPLVIPHDFEDGKHALFFEHAGDLRDRLAHALAHPAEVARIARAGHAHLREHHTATARARQLLGRIQARLAR